MHFSIRKIILWPKNTNRAPRTLRFVDDKINLITGRSRTGKSSITYVVDYVLGSGKCAIPVGEIRNTVAWYGILVDVGGSEMLIAREEPGERAQSANFYVEEAAEVEIPHSLQKNTNQTAFKIRMDRLAGLPNLDFDPEKTGRGYSGRPSFRDMAAFNFQPQHIVANPYTLFFKADTTKHREKLKTIFPFVLGAVTVRSLAAEHETAELESRLKKLRAELTRRQRAVETWRAEAFGLFARAQELGLVSSAEEAPRTFAACLAALSQISENLDSRGLPAFSPGATERAVRELQLLRSEERKVDEELGVHRRRLARIRSLTESLRGFGSVASEQSARLSGVGWLSKTLRHGSDCPVCGVEGETAKAHLEELADAAEELQAQQAAADSMPPALERETQQVSEEIQKLEQQLRDLRTQRAELEGERARRGGQTLEAVYHFAGRVAQAVKNVHESGDEGDIQQQIDSYETRLAELRRLLDARTRQRRLENALDDIARRIEHYAQFMSLERSNDPIGLNIKDLTLLFKDPRSSRKDYLWEIGSGANWMGYHISALLGIHEHLLRAELSPVPRFLIIDQPSQVYFPGDIPEDAGESHDVLATRRIFEALALGLSRSGGRLQIIVAEHADEKTLGGVGPYHVVANWHGENDDYLIPRSWLADQP